jgi:hypothetical protein
MSFGLVMCRLAARSDAAHLVEVAEWIATGNASGGEVASFEPRSDQREFDVQSGRYGATG